VGSKLGTLKTKKDYDVRVGTEVGQFSLFLRTIGFDSLRLYVKTELILDFTKKIGC
jgi:hypothetical protein